MELASDNQELLGYADRLEDLSYVKKYRKMLISKRLQKNLKLQENEFNAYLLVKKKVIKRRLEN